ncbi:Zinc finger RING-type [Penicillium taxi]|uniref:Zinc finger RING-type n=1 Tax=Penicillium taxi TaxID=168475 RepID=UPI002545B2D8|nr:Zinc finger RING-type [Penicillium taxi]KAJ5907455.1 Zinc finger RING-type [Penicillium taxi]
MRLLYISLLFLSVQSFVLSPSNTSLNLPRDQFAIQESTLSGILLIPLTQGLIGLSDSEKKSLNISGNLTEVKADNSLGLSSTSIACIPCDASAYSGPLTASDTLDYVVTSKHPALAVILYSTSAIRCNLTTDNQTEAYQKIFTVIGARSVSTLQRSLNSTPTATIVSMSGVASGFDPTPTSRSPGSSTQTSGSGPNTEAMIILYSITGVITALFLGIIVTGAVRAHRHPERYGPRIIGAGRRRARQSRARGIARAMLETIPIVKFGDEDNVAATKRDIELEGDEHIADVAEVGPEVDGTETPTPIATDRPTSTSTDLKDTKPEAGNEGNFVCPICTDDFIRGQDLRVLPCNHQFHPECIDPWLVNVSGTCPLCRIDLNPKEETADQHDNAELGEAEVQRQAEVPGQRQSHRVSSLINGRGHLDLRRMYDSTVEERLHALRYLRATRHDEEQSSNRMSTRFRDRFRIHTRAHGVETPGSAPTTPTVTVPHPCSHQRFMKLF